MAPVTFVEQPDPAPQPQPTDNAGQSFRLSNRPASPEMDNTLSDVLAYGLPGLGVGFGDTVGQSLRIFGDDTVQNALKVIAPGGFGDFYARNKEPLRAGGEIVGMFIPGMIGLKALNWTRGIREAGKLGQILKNSTAADALLGNSATLGAAEQKISSAATATRNAQGIWSGKSFINPAMTQAKKEYYTARLFESARQTAAFEVATRVLYNDSETFSPADYSTSDELKWLGGSLVAGAGIDYAMAKYAVRNLIKASQATQATYANSEWANVAGDIITRPNERGVAAAYFARTWQYADEAIRNSNNPTFATHAKQDLTRAENNIVSVLDEMATDKHSLDNILPKIQIVSEGNKITRSGTLLLGAVKNNENLTLFASSVRGLPENKGAFYTDIDENITRARGDLEELQTISAFDLGGKNKLDVKGRGKNKQIITLPQKFATASLEDLTTAQAKLDKLIEVNNEFHIVVENTGDTTIYRTRADNFLDKNDFSDLKRTAFQEKETVAGQEKPVKHTRLSNADNSVSLDDRFVLNGPANFSPMQWSTSYALGSKLIADWKPVEGQVFILNNKVPRFQAEAILNLAKQNEQAKSLLQFTPEIKDMKDAEFYIVDEKYKDFVKLMDKTESVGPTNIDYLAKAGKLTPEQVTQQLNLPLAIGLQPHPLLQVFAQARLQRAKSLTEIFTKKSLTPNTHPLDLLQAAMRDAVDAEPSTVFETSGKLFLQTDAKPIMITTRSVPSLSHNDALIHSIIEANQAIHLARMGEIDPKIAPITAGVVRGIGSMAALPVAKNVNSLFEGIAAGRGIATGQDRVADQVETIKAISLITQESDKQILKYVGDLFDKALTPLSSALQAKNNRPHLIDFNRIEQSYRFGWDIAKPEAQGDGSFRYVLKDTPMNRKLFVKYFGENADKDAFSQAKVYMPDMSVTAQKAMRRDPMPLTVSKEAAVVANAISALSRQSGIEVNSMRVATGKSAVSIRDFHLPTPEYSNKDAWFIRNSQGNVIGTYSRGSEAQNRQRAEAAAAELSKIYDETHTAVALDTVKQEHTFDDNFFGLYDYSDQLAKSSTPITGGLAHLEIDHTDNTLKNMVQSLAQQYLNAGTRARASLFEAQLNFAKQASQIEGKAVGKENNIFDRYMAIIFSRSTQSSQGVVGRAYGSVENAFDTALSHLYSLKSEATARTDEGVKQAKGLRAYIRARTDEKLYRQYQDKLGKWSPFDTTQKWMESTYPEINHKGIKDYATQLSKASATMSLRFLDLGTPLLNLFGIYAMAPAVLTGMRRLANETEDQHLSRIGAWGSTVSFVPGAKSFSAMKALLTTQHAFWSGELNEPMKRAAAYGTFKPEYSALNDVLTKPTQGKPGLLSRFVEGASSLADKSEAFTRSMAWSMGYKFGKDVLKIDNEKNLFIFANNTMNDMIGNYSPRNKPGMFQGAVGLPLGAFQTFMFNFYRRGYGYIERGDLRSIVAQYATQASMFGAASVPGWGAFNSMLFSNYDGSDNMATRLDRHLPPGVSELLLHGSLSTIPQIFGRGDLNIAFYPRGSVDLTQVPPNPISAVLNAGDINRAPPPIQLLSNIAQGINKTVNNFMSAGKFSIQEQEEIMAQFSTNRAIRSIMEFAAGAKTDRVGQVVENATFDAIHVAAAIAGAVPSSTRAAMDAYNAQQLVEHNQENVRAILNEKTRAVIRGGEFDVSDLQDLIKDYMRSGGNPAYFGQWLRNTVETSFIPKADKKMKELAMSGKMTEFLNLLAAMQRNQVSPGGTNARTP